MENQKANNQTGYEVNTPWYMWLFIILYRILFPKVGFIDRYGGRGSIIFVICLNLLATSLIITLPDVPLNQEERIIVTSIMWFAVYHLTAIISRIW